MRFDPDPVMLATAYAVTAAAGAKRGQPHVIGADISAGAASRYCYGPLLHHLRWAAQQHHVSRLDVVVWSDDVRAWLSGDSHQLIDGMRMRKYADDLSEQKFGFFCEKALIKAFGGPLSCVVVCDGYLTDLETNQQPLYDKLAEQRIGLSIYSDVVGGPPTVCPWPFIYCRDDRYLLIDEGIKANVWADEIRCGDYQGP